MSQPTPLQRMETAIGNSVSEAEVEAAAKILSPFAFKMNCSVPDCQECDRQRSGALATARNALTAAAQVRPQAGETPGRFTRTVTGLSKLIADIEPIAVTDRLRKSLSDARSALDMACRSTDSRIGLIPIYDATEDISQSDWNREIAAPAPRKGE